MTKSVFTSPPDTPRERIKEIRESSSFLIRNLIHDGPFYNKKVLVDLGTLHYLYARVLELEEQAQPKIYSYAGGDVRDCYICSSNGISGSVEKRSFGVCEDCLKDACKNTKCRICNEPIPYWQAYRAYEDARRVPGVVMACQICIPQKTNSFLYDVILDWATVNAFAEEVRLGTAQMVPQETFWSIITEQMAEVESELQGSNLDGALTELKKMKEIVSRYKSRGCIVTEGESGQLPTAEAGGLVGKPNSPG